MSTDVHNQTLDVMRDAAIRQASIRKRAKYRMIEFVRPDGYWPYPYTLEQAFGVFAWMVKTGGEPVRALLSRQPTCSGFNQVNPIQSLADLEKRFHYALLSKYGGPDIASWRNTFGVNLDASPIIAFDHYRGNGGGTNKSEHGFQGDLQAMFDCIRPLVVQLNSCHADAIETYGVEIRLGCLVGWNFVLKYGVDGSRWYLTLAHQESPRDCFPDIAYRAIRKLEELTGVS